jgi:hypothetical protein
MQDTFYFYLSHALALLILSPLIGEFGGCQSVYDAFHLFYRLSALEQFGVVTAVFMVGISGYELIKKAIRKN